MTKAKPTDPTEQRNSLPEPEGGDSQDSTSGRRARGPDKAPRELSKRFVCPTCQKLVISRQGLYGHLLRGGCTRRHTSEEARRLSASAATDPTPYFEARERLSAVVEALATKLKNAKGPDKDSLRLLLELNEGRLRRLKAGGHEKFNPADYDDPPPRR